ncbi:DUF1127 domain-containing protein [Sulfitobacter aestuarii]|uniref:DUF1127 domain-containing protein n=1 Tax=Sulfitobacter aestuarii TaxID=2161676 RepID=A0ABW5U909_9RHOB
MTIYITRKMLADFARGSARVEPFGVFYQLGRSIARYGLRRRAIAELEAMDDATLRDIGIYRGDIRRVVDGLSDADLGLRRPRQSSQEIAGKPKLAAGQNVSPA